MQRMDRILSRSPNPAVRRWRLTATFLKIRKRNPAAHGLFPANQADSMMGHAGMERSGACTQPAASFALADYAAETEDESYCLLWEAMKAAFEQLGAQGCTAANCVFTDGMIILMR